MNAMEAEDRVAILLRLVDDDVAETILANLPANRVDRIRKLRDALSHAPPSQRAVDQVVDQFENMFHFASEHIQPRLKVIHGDSTDTTTDGQAARSAVPKLKCFVPTDDPFADLEQLAPFQIAGALLQEQPRTVALVLNCLDSERASETLQRLPPELRSQVFLEMKENPTASKDLLERIVRTTIRKGCNLEEGALADAETESDKRLATMLRGMDRTDRSQILESLVENDPETAERVKQLLYVFDDLMRVKDRSLQKLLAEIDSSTLGTALSGAESELVDKVMNNLSKRARATLAEEMDLMGEIDAEAAADARNAVCEVLARLDQEGQLTMT